MCSNQRNSTQYIIIINTVWTMSFQLSCDTQLYSTFHTTADPEVPIQLPDSRRHYTAWISMLRNKCPHKISPSFGWTSTFKFKRRNENNKLVITNFRDLLPWLLFLYPSHPNVTTVACKRFQSFYQKCRWQVTAKHTCTLPMWLWMVWHDAWLYGVHRTCQDSSSFMWHQPCKNQTAL